MPDPIHTPTCFAAHMGVWLAEPSFVRRAHAAIVAGVWQAAAPGQRDPSRITVVATPVLDPATAGSDWPEVAYLRTDDGIAIIEMAGAMAKSAGKYARCGTVNVRRYMRQALADSEVRAILLSIDSPGGTVAGTQALGDEVRAADAIKPTFAHIEDLGASAAYWTASQARRVTANRSALVGSLGTYAVVEDSSEAYKAAGVKVHVLSTGPHKGAGAEGAPVTDAQLAEMQATVDALNALFVEAVAGGRRLSLDQARALFDGRVHVAERAQALGLIDAVQSMDQAIAEIGNHVRSVAAAADANARRLKLAQRR